jgi:hypothetical protein
LGGVYIDDLRCACSHELEGALQLLKTSVVSLMQGKAFTLQKDIACMSFRPQAILVDFIKRRRVRFYFTAKPFYDVIDRTNPNVLRFKL